MEEHVRRGLELKKGGRYKEAASEFLAAIGVDENDAGAHRQLGLVYGFAGRFDESLEELKRAVALNGRDLEARNDLAMTCAMLGMYDEAKAEFLCVLETDPSNEVARRGMFFFQSPHEVGAAGS